jgi:heptosyltransferase III
LAYRQKILIYLIGSLGDSIAAIPAFRLARRSFPGAEIVLLQNTQAEGIARASDVIPENLFDRTMSYAQGVGRKGSVGQYLNLWNRVRRERFDGAVYVVISHRPPFSVVRDKIFFRTAGIPRLYGFRPLRGLYPKGSDGRPAMTEHEAVRKLRRLGRDRLEQAEGDLAVPLIIPTDADLERVDAWLQQRRMRPEATLAAIAPGCKTIANKWPEDRFIELGERLIAAGGHEIVITGGPAEFELGERMISAWGKGLNAAGAFDVRGSAALLARSRFYIGTDTGTTHLASAVGTPCFTLYGERNNPGHWFPLGKGHMLLHHPVPCAGCLAETCPVPGHPCMTGITVQDVWSHLQAFIRQLDERAGDLQVIAV